MEYLLFILFASILCAYVAASRQCYFSCNCSERLFPSINRTLYTLDCGFIGFNSLPINATLRRQSAFILSGNGYASFLDITGLLGIRNLAYLDLSHNKINTLSNFQVNGDFLKELNLDSNLLDYVPADAFTATSELQVLSLASNRIEVIHARGFTHLSYLKHLNMSANRLSQINPLWFSVLERLELLDLSNNNIHELSDGVFKNLKRLKTLSLHGNDFHTLDQDSFAGLIDLKTLFLNNNHIKTIPTTAMQIFKQMKLIDLSGNHFRRLTPRTLFRINVTCLRINYQDDLLLVERNSVTEMPYLEVLELHNNKKLVYISPEAFSRTLKLRTLDLHGNALRTVEYRMIEALPSLTSVSFHGNPVDCSCSIHWVLDDVYVRSKITILQLEHIVCSSPPSLKNKHLYKQERQFPKTCKPQILPLFEKSIHVVHGEEFSLDCRSYGVPTPAILWQTPHGVLYANNSEIRHLRVLESGTLVSSAAFEEDTGLYSCVSSNPRGQVARHMRVLVKQMKAALIILNTKPDSIAVTWNGTSNYNQYEILCKLPKSNNQTCATVKLAPYMRSYTITGLKPNTRYFMCIAMLHPGHEKHERCQQVETKSYGSITAGILNIRPYVLGVGVGGTVSLVAIALIVLLAYLRHKRNQQRMKELYGDNLSQMFLASVDSFSDITPMTYENLAAQVFDEDDIAEIRGTSAFAASVTPEA
ncbi:leucine-rich repeat neuronal protein 3-like [Lineus longissimus]|uniref:leucine-rich repeat neuronal protein 3-like n=1 Tax=Lineus longissimus TaxID=88925 RepID=UPI00315D30F6